MKKTLLFICFIIGVQTANAQITEKGYKTFDWGTDKLAFTRVVEDCNQSFLDADLENCLIKGDSLFLNEFAYKYLNYRFYKGHFFEVNIDFDNGKLPYIIAKLTKLYGNPTVLSKETNPEVKNPGFILYEWRLSDTNINLLKKDESMPAWLNIASGSIKKTIPNKGEIDIEKLLFE